jgi:hypothetical protein
MSKTCPANITSEVIHNYSVLDRIDMFFSIFRVYSEIVFEKFFFHFVFLSSRGLKIGLKHVILSKRKSASVLNASYQILDV